MVRYHAEKNTTSRKSKELIFFKIELFSQDYYLCIFCLKKNTDTEETFKLYPIRIQNFEDLRNNKYVYVDKTELIYRLTHTYKTYFLSRPRRLK